MSYNVVINLLREGNANEPKYVAVVTKIEGGEGERIVIPSEYMGYPVSHIGFKEQFRPGYQEWIDYHHFKDGDYVPDGYKLISYKMELPKGSTLFLPCSIDYISYKPDETVSFELEDGHPNFIIKDGRPRRKISF